MSSSPILPGPTNFFSLPGELREVIYDLVAAENNAVYQGVFSPAISQMEHSIEDPAYYGISGTRQKRSRDGRVLHGKPPFVFEEGSKTLRPSSNAVAHASRGTYLESSYRHYNDNKFLIYSGFLLQKFVQDINRVHIRSIKHLEISDLSLMTSLSGRTDPDLDETSKEKDHISGKQLALLREFHGLQTLCLKGHHWFYGGGNHKTGWWEPMSRLATLGKALPHLQRIELQQDLHHFYLLGYLSMSMKLDPSLGWKYEFAQTSTDSITEVLERECGHNPSDLDLSGLRLEGESSRGRRQSVPVYEKPVVFGVWTDPDEPE